MIIKVRVRAGSGRQGVEKIGARDYIVNLKERAEDGRANLELIKLLKKEFKGKIEFKDINIIKGKKGKDKIVMLE